MSAVPYPKNVVDVKYTAAMSWLGCFPRVYRVHKQMLFNRQQKVKLRSKIKLMFLFRLFNCTRFVEFVFCFVFGYFLIDKSACSICQRIKSNPYFYGRRLQTSKYLCVIFHESWQMCVHFAKWNFFSGFLFINRSALYLLDGFSFTFNFASYISQMCTRQSNKKKNNAKSSFSLWKYIFEMKMTSKAAKKSAKELCTQKFNQLIYISISIIPERKKKNTHQYETMLVYGRS